MPSDTDTTTALIAYAAALGTLATAAAVLWWLVKPRVVAWVSAEIIAPVQQTNRQITVNGHTSAAPTMLDKVTDLGTQQDRLAEQMAQVIEVNRRQDVSIVGVRRNQTALALVVDEHLRWAREQSTRLGLDPPDDRL